MEAEKPNGRNGSGGVPLPPLLPPFLTKCYDMVDDPATDETVCWGDGDNTFIIRDQHAFSRDLLPKYFKHNNLSSFIRQLNTYGFRKVDPDNWVFKNEGFVKGQKDLLKTITRKKPSHNNIQQQQSQGKLSSVKAVEVGQFGIEEEIERLKRDKNLLMQELVKVRQYQQNNDTELHDLRQRLQGMELNQQQMLSFLAMAVQNPTFLAQLVQQNIKNRFRSDMKKKRRLPALEEGIMDGGELSDKQIIMYGPSVMETSDHHVEPIFSSDPPSTPQSVFDGVTDLCANVDQVSIDETTCKASDDGDIVLPDFSDYLEKLLASPVLENNVQTEPLHFDMPDFKFDFDFPDIEMETSESPFPSDEKLQ